MSRLRRLRRSTGVLLSTGFRATPGWMLVTLVLQLAAGISGASYPYVVRVFVDALAKHENGKLFALAMLLAGLFFVMSTSMNFGGVSGFVVSAKAGQYLTMRTAELINKVPGIEHFERPEYLRDLDLLTANRQNLASAPQQLMLFFSQVVRTVIMLVLLASVDPFFLLVPVALVAPLVADNWSIRYRQKNDEALAETNRLANALFALSASAAPAKELRVFGLTDELIDRHRALSRTIVSRTRRAGYVAAGLGSLGWFVFAAGFIAVVAAVVIQAIHGHASAGQVLMVILLAQNIQLQLGLVTGTSGQLLQARKTAERFIWLSDHAEAHAPVSGDVPVPDRLVDGITFDHVSFSYPGTTVPVLSDVSLRLPSGSAIAIVGDNGAGKTTLTKLLTRMYDPSAGTITVDGIDLSTFDVAAWRATTAATFQDFARYELRAGSAVGIGDLPRFDDDEAVLEAMVKAGADDVLSKFDDGLDTLLGRSFPDGRELSGGEWQKIALGRGRMREGPLLLVLDEPTSSVDAPTEFALFDRYIAAAREAARLRGAITILVSHRFSTVRMADLIVVIQDGHVAEVGSHEALMTARGIYQELFSLQERAYR